MGKRNFGLIGPVQADLGEIRVIRGLKWTVSVEAAQKFDHRL